MQVQIIILERATVASTKTTGAERRERVYISIVKGYE